MNPILLQSILFIICITQTHSCNIEDTFVIDEITFSIGPNNLEFMQIPPNWTISMPWLYDNKIESAAFTIDLDPIQLVRSIDPELGILFESNSNKGSICNALYQFAPGIWLCS